MDLLTNDQDLIGMEDYWLHYFHLDDLPPFGDDTLFEWLDKQGKDDISAWEFPYFDPIDEDLSLWDCFDSSLPLLCLKDDNTTQSHGSSGEAYSSSITTTITTSTTTATVDHGDRSGRKRVRPIELEFPYFDPIDEDLSLWDCYNSSLPLLCLKDDNTIQSHGSSGEAYSSTTTITTSTTTTTDPVDHGDRSRRKRVRPLEFEEIRQHFEMPIAMAAKELNVGLTVLKKRCRELNIKRWPHRKLKSLKCLIHTVKDMRLNKEEIEMLEGQKRMMEKQPEMELTLRTKQLRQACFKASYTKKRLKSRVF